MLFVLILSSFLSNTFQQALVSYETSRVISENFETKLDTSLYFHFHHQRQKKQRHLCSSFDGPKCRFLNNKSIEVKPSEDPDVKELKEKILSGLLTNIANLDEKKKGNPNLLYFYGSDQFRLMLDKKRITGYIPTVRRVLNLIDFEKVIIGKAAVELTKGFLLNHVTPYKFSYQEIPQAYYEPSKTTTAVRFNGFMVPPESIVPKKGKENKEKNKLDQQQTGSTLLPGEIYIFVPESQQGIINFNNPLRVKHFFTRKHNFLAYKATINEQKGEKFQYAALGYLHGVPVHRFFYMEGNLNFNKWIKLNGPENQDQLIDTIIIEPNSDIDNLFLEIETEFDRSSLKPEAKAAVGTNGAPVKAEIFTKESDILNLIGLNNIEDLDNLDFIQEYDLLELSKTLQSLLEKDLIINKDGLEKDEGENTKKKKNQRGKKKV